MKMVNTSADALIEGKKNQTLSVRQLNLELDKIRNNSPKPLDALAADALALLLRIASTETDKKKRKALIEGIVVTTKAFNHS